MFPQKLNFCYIYSTMMYEIWSVAKHICHLTDYSLKKIEAIQGFDIWIIAAATEYQWTRKQKNSLKNNTVCTSCMVTSNTIIGFFAEMLILSLTSKIIEAQTAKYVPKIANFFRILATLYERYLPLVTSQKSENQGDRVIVIGYTRRFTKRNQRWLDHSSENTRLYIENKNVNKSKRKIFKVCTWCLWLCREEKKILLLAGIMKFFKLLYCNWATHIGFFTFIVYLLLKREWVMQNWHYQ